MIDHENDNDSGAEEFSPEHNEDETFNQERERALEHDARRAYEDLGADL